MVGVIRQQHVFPGPDRIDLSPVQLFVQIALMDEIFFGFAVELFDVGGVAPVETIGEDIRSSQRSRLVPCAKTNREPPVRLGPKACKR